MNPTWALVVVSLLLISFQPAHSQSPVAVSQNPQAVATLTQCLSAVGVVSAISSIQDYTATGNITYYWADQPVQGTVTLQGLGASDFRLDAMMPDGTHTWAVSAGAGFARGVSGNVIPFSYADAVNLAGFGLPFISLMKSLSDTSMSVSNIGTAQLNGHSVLQVQLRKVLPTAVDPTGQISTASTQVYSVDATSFQLVDFQYQTIPNDHTTQSIPHDVQYSGYQQVNGLLLPFTITELVGGQQVAIIQLSSLKFNTGLTDPTFQP